MNKQELIKHIEGLPYTEGFFVDTVRIGRSGLLKLINQLDGPQKPVVKQFVADWYEEHKDDLEFNIWDWIKYTQEEEKIENRQFTEWLGGSENKPVETLVKMKLYGYTVEKEKRYLVKMKNLRALFCYLAYIPDEGYWTLMASGGESIVIKHTRKELEEAGFGEVFNSPLFEVEEVE